MTRLEKLMIRLMALIIVGNFYSFSFVYADAELSKINRAMINEIIDQPDQAIPEILSPLGNYKNSLKDGKSLQVIAPSTRFTCSGCGEQGRTTDRRFSREERIENLKELIKQDPNNCLYHLDLAEVYAAQGEGVLTIIHAQKAIELTPPQEELAKAYRLSAMGYYFDGQFQKSVEAIQKALDIDREDQAALGFQKMLETVDEHISRQETVERIAQGYGYEKPEKIIKAFKQEGMGDINQSKRYDYITFDFGRLRFKTPKGWFKKENLKISPFTKALLLYNKFADRSVPQIGIIKDIPLSQEQTAVEFTTKVKQMMEQKNIPGLKISEPVVIVINGYSTSFIEITSPQTQSKSAWYQFLIEGVIVSIQYTNTMDQYQMDLPIVQKFVTGMKVELKSQRGGF